MHNVEDNIARLMGVISTEHKETRDAMGEMKDQCDALDNLLSPSKQLETENEILQVGRLLFHLIQV